MALLQTREIKKILQTHHFSGLMAEERKLWILRGVSGPQLEKHGSLEMAELGSFPAACFSVYEMTRIDAGTLLG